MREITTLLWLAEISRCRRAVPSFGGFLSLYKDALSHGRSGYRTIECWIIGSFSSTEVDPLLSAYLVQDPLHHTQWLTGSVTVWMQSSRESHTRSLMAKLIRPRSARKVIPYIYPCETQPASEVKTHKSSPTEINLGYKGVIPRWKSGSVITWVAVPDDYDSETDAAFAEEQFVRAAEQWNSLQLGVSFAKAERAASATFQLAYNGDNGETLAESFFPNTKTGNHLYVYGRALKKDARDYLQNVFLHELGHVLGLRHEFAAESGDFVLFGGENQASVMGYNWPPDLTSQDISETREFYMWTEPEISTEENSYKVVDMVPRGGR